MGCHAMWPVGTVVSVPVALLELEALVVLVTVVPGATDALVPPVTPVLELQLEAAMVRPTRQMMAAWRTEPER